MSKEYYLVNDKEKEEMQVCRYSFDAFHPNGDEVIVTSRSYSKRSPFSKEDAADYCNKMMQKFNSKKFRRERPVYYD